MRNQGSVFCYERERNKDLMDAFNRELKYRNYSSINEVWERVANSPSKRFWVSETRAAIVISKMEHGDLLENATPQRREMYFEIFERYKKIRSEMPEESLQKIVSSVVCSQAPKFYLTPSSIRVIVYKIQRGWYERKKIDIL